MREGRHWEWQKNSDVRCPNDGELVNFRCWLCHWDRDPTEQQAAQMGIATPLWHGEKIRAQQQREQRDAEERKRRKEELAQRRAGWPRLIQQLHDEVCVGDSA